MADIGEILGSAKPMEHDVTICVRGDLLAEYEAAERELQEIGDFKGERMSPTEEQRRAAQRVVDIREEMKKAQHTFRFRALGAKAWSDLQAGHPPRDGHDERWNLTSFPAALIAACAADPVMDQAQVYALFEVLAEGERDQLFTAAWIANTGKVGIPFSSRASKILESSG